MNCRNAQLSTTYDLVHTLIYELYRKLETSLMLGDIKIINLFKKKI